MRKIIFILISIVTLPSVVHAQEFAFHIIERAEQKQLKYEDAAMLAKQYFDSAGTGSETGYKHFQRWLYEQKFHIDENGFLIDPKSEWEKWQNTSPSGLSNRVTAIVWNEMGPWGWTYSSSWNPGTGRLTDVAIHPSDTTTIFVTSPGGGIWKSTNSGASWVPLQDFNATWLNMYAVTIDPSNTNTVFAGNGSGNIMKSINAGSTWATTGTGPTGTVRKIMVDPTNSNIVFVCSNAGIHRSINGGSIWTLVYGTQIEDIEFKTDDVNIMIASGNTTVLRSTDNGVTWTTLGAVQGITNTGRTLVTVTPANPNYVYVLQASGSEFGRMYRSTDAGLTFITTVVGNRTLGTNYFGYSSAGTDAGGQATYDMALCASPKDANDVYIAGIIVWRSINGGTSFTAQTIWSYPNGLGYNHADVHGLRWVNNTLYSNSDGGIFKSMDFADNWTNISTGLGIRQFYRIACSPTDANVITGGAQDNGSVTRKPAGNWVDWLGADGMEGLVSPSNVNNLWGTSQNGSIYRSTNGGNSYSNLTKPSNGNWVTPLAIHPTNQNTLYGGWTGFYKSINGGVNWTLLSGSTITAALDDIAIAPSDTNYIYASRGSALYVSTDAGVTWVTRTALGTISDICVHRTIPSRIYITTTSSSNQLQMSTDAGVTFTNISSGLPSVAARSVAIENNGVKGLYVGMNTGIYYKNDTMTAWRNHIGNLPSVAINEIDIQYSSNLLRAATYGRGVWETPLFTPSVLAVNWLSFAAAKANNGIALQWSVHNETNLTKYELQRSDDGVNFKPITTFKAQGLALANYNYLDLTLVRGIVYYRVKEIDENNISYTNIVSIKINDKIPSLKVFPNPVTSGILRFGFINSQGLLYEINILATDGRMMLIDKQKDGIGSLDITKLAAGTYQLVIKQGAEMYTQKFVVLSR